MYDITNSNNKNLVLDAMVDIIKKNGNIFLLGYPTTNIIMLMLKLYHENIVRIINSAPPIIPLMFMTGMLENDNIIYVTISESQREGIDYDKKLNMYYSLLKNSGCNIEFIDGLHDIELDTSYKNGTTDFNETDYDKIKDLIFIDKENKLNYSSIIKNYPLTVKLINGTEYIRRREEGFSFVPFKRINPDNSVHCIYGSLCVEAKLFSYMYSLGKKWNDFDGYLAYWIGNKLPPNHILKKYNYIQNSDDDAKLERMINISKSLINEHELHELNNICINSNSSDSTEITNFIENPKCRNIFVNALQPIALTCPGCYMNWQSYINNIQSNWDSSVCTPINKTGGKKISHITKNHKTYKKGKLNKRNKKRQTKKHKNYKIKN